MTHPVMIYPNLCGTHNSSLISITCRQEILQLDISPAFTTCAPDGHNPSRVAKLARFLFFLLFLVLKVWCYIPTTLNESRPRDFIGRDEDIFFHLSF
jgi:hypothetical protein